MFILSIQRQYNAAILLPTANPCHNFAVHRGNSSPKESGLPMHFFSTKD